MKGKTGRTSQRQFDSSFHFSTKKTDFFVFDIFFSDFVLLSRCSRTGRRDWENMKAL
jgi:hypothetical protein